jgi:hypothetical protein
VLVAMRDPGIRRCRVAGNGNHFDSATGNCEGQVVEHILGYST